MNTTSPRYSLFILTVTIASAFVLLAMAPLEGPFGVHFKILGIPSPDEMIDFETSYTVPAGQRFVLTCVGLDVNAVSTVTLTVDPPRFASTEEFLIYDSNAFNQSSPTQNPDKTAELFGGIVFQPGETVTLTATSGGGVNAVGWGWTETLDPRGAHVPGIPGAHERVLFLKQAGVNTAVTIPAGKIFVMQGSEGGQLLTSNGVDKAYTRGGDFPPGLTFEAGVAQVGNAWGYFADVAPAP